MYRKKRSEKAIRERKKSKKRPKKKRTNREESKRTVRQQGPGTMSVARARTFQPLNNTKVSMISQA